MDKPSNLSLLKKENPCFRCRGPESPRRPGCHATCEQYNKWRTEKNRHNEYLYSIKLKNGIIYGKSPGGVHYQ